MVEVFDACLAEGATRRPASELALLAREARDLPGNLLSAHLVSSREDVVTPKRLRRLALVLLVLLAVDWALGVLIVHDRLPLWTFAVANFPFGLLHVGLESTWTGTHYVVAGHTVGEIASLNVFLFVVIAQGLLYFALLEHRAPTGAPAVPDAGSPG